MRTIETNSKYSLKPFDEQRCIFVHIPRCAGVSICKTLFCNLAGGHMSIREYQIAFSKSEFNSYFKFTFVRNPWDRLVSAYFFLNEGGLNESDRKWAKENLSPYTDFDSFVKGWVNRENVHSWNHFCPQYTYIFTKGSTTPMLDFIGRFENLEKDFLYIQKRTGIDSKLLCLNRTEARNKDYKTYYTDATKQIVADVYRDDIEILGYNFDNLALEKQLWNRFN